MWVMATVVGCDNAPPPPAVAAPARPTGKVVAVAVRPTTQELLTGRNKRLQLPGLTMSITVPESWHLVEAPGAVPAARAPAAASDPGRLDPHGAPPAPSAAPMDITAASVEGASPGGDVEIKAIDYANFTKDQMKSHLEGGKRIADREKDRTRVFDVRPLGNTTVLEHMTVAPKQKVPYLDEKGNVAERMATPITWDYTYFVPVGERFHVYIVNIQMVTLEQLEGDREFFKKIIDSITIDAAP